MRIRTIGWSLLALAVVVLAFYALNRGVLVGSKIETAKLSDDYPLPLSVLYRHSAGVDQLRIHQARG
jgi:hypothetical protein